MRSGLGDEPVPGVAAGVDDGVVAVEDAVAELVRSAGRPRRSRPGSAPGCRAASGSRVMLAGTTSVRRSLVPAGAVEVRTACAPGATVAADLGQVQVHRVGVCGGQDEAGADAAGRADGTEQVGPGVALVRGAARARASSAHSRVVVPCWPTRASSCHHSSSGLPRRAAAGPLLRGRRSRAERRLGAAASWPGWRGRGTSRREATPAQHVPTLRSAITTPKCRSIARARSARRHRVDPVARRGPGPSSTQRITSRSCSGVSRHGVPPP